MLPLLTLNHSTLFYWTLSDSVHNKRKRDDQVKDWALAVPKGVPTSRAANSSSSTSHVRSAVPLLTSGTTSRSSALSVLTDDVKIIRHQTSESLTRVEPKPVSTTGIRFYDNGGLSDNDEMRGEEREAAIASPFKGKKRVTSEVCNTSV
jgi:hypothetical protein